MESDAFELLLGANTVFWGVAESVHLVVADVNPGDRQQMLMYARSPSGTWFGIRLVNEGGLAGRHTCEDPDVANVSDIALCAGVAW